MTAKEMTAMHPSVTRARELHDLMERYIETRRRAFLPRARAIAAEAGLDARDLLFLAYTRQVADGDLVPIAHLTRRAVYSTKEGWRVRMGTLVAAGLAEPVAEGWRLTPRGRALVDLFWEADHAHRASLPLPAEPLRRVVATLEGILRGVEGGPGDRVTSIRRTAPADRERAADAVRAEQAMFELAVTLDDGHIRAWERAGHTGPSVDVLTQVWYGKTSDADLREALSSKQEQPDIDRHVEALVGAGHLRRTDGGVALTEQGRAAREAIERETDRLGLEHWPRGETLEQMIRDMTALVEALPAEADLPAGPTH